ncbi:MAG: PilZ domain-containing protein [Syntrophales bacterium]
MRRGILKPRKYPRFYTNEPTFIVVSAYREEGQKMRKFPIIDISEGGCAFIYDTSEKELVQSGCLSFFFKDMLYIENLDFITRSDTLFSRITHPSNSLRRRGVEFKGLELPNQERLKEFIMLNCRAS